MVNNTDPSTKLHGRGAADGLESRPQRCRYALAMPAVNPARRAVAEAIARVAARFPNLPPSHLDTAALDPADAALATAIHRTVLQRWLTLEHLLAPLVKPGLARIEPALRAVLLTGGAQLLFMDRLPAYAVVNDAAELARAMVRPRAAGLANAVLRRVAELPARREPDSDWHLAGDVLPLDAGVLRLAQPLLPDPAERLDKHLAIATSHPARLIRRWLAHHDADAVSAIARQSIRTPSTFVAVEPGFDPADAADQPAIRDQRSEITHLCWQADHASLTRFLAAQPLRRVQDPASTASVAAARDLPARTILDEVQRVPATALHREAVPCRVQYGCGRPPRARAGRPHHRRRIAARFGLPVGAVVSLEPNMPTSRTVRWCRRSPVGYQVLHFNHARHHAA